MKVYLLVVIAALCVLSFCPAVQQTFSASAPTVQPIADETEDSDLFFQRATTRPAPKKNYSRDVAALVAKMTLEEKIGQMTQLEIGMITKGEGNNIQIDPEKLEKAVVKYGSGSILNVKDQALTLDKWHEIITAIQNASQKTRLKIPVIYGIDSIHGAGYIQGATLFPQEIGMAATWNPVLMQRGAEVAAAETRAAGIPWTFSPVLDLGRQPLWPRFWETFGEDPYLTKVMGAAFVRGIEGDDVSSSKSVATSLKHYVGYSFPLTGRDRTPAWIPENYMREYFLPPFAAAVKAGARTIMVNSAEVNGIPGHVNHHLLTEVLRNELGFDGFVVSDWQDIQKLVTEWRVAADEKEATRQSIMAGVDMSMVPQSYTFSDLLLQLVKENKVPMSRIDEAVSRILLVKYQIGLFDRSMPDASLKANFATASSRAIALEAARESITLLKNEGSILPLSKDRKILVTGPTADSLISLNNGWTYVWQGNNLALYPKDRDTVLGAIKAKAGDKVTYVPGVSFDKEIDIEAAVKAAQAADVAVVCIGESSYTETPGNITDLTMSEPQLKLAERIAATGKPVVLVLVEGRPRVINRIVAAAKGILLAYNPSNEGGTAIADVLFGDYNPNGRLPYSYPRTPNGLISYDHKLFETEVTSYGNTAFSPQFEFGSGLSYTNFAYSNLQVTPKTAALNGEVKVSVTVTNKGQRAGKETVIVYVRDIVATLSPAGKRVRRFAKISLEPGASKTLTFTLRTEDLSFIGTNNKPVIEPGDFEVLIGGLSDKFTLK
jgi:beta-glucosidase